MVYVWWMYIRCPLTWRLATVAKEVGPLIDFVQRIFSNYSGCRNKWSLRYICACVQVFLINRWDDLWWLVYKVTFQPCHTKILPGHLVKPFTFRVSFRRSKYLLWIVCTSSVIWQKFGMTQRYLRMPFTERILPPLGYFHMRIMNPDNLLNNWHTQIIPLEWNESIGLPEVHVQVLLADSCPISS